MAELDLDAIQARAEAATPGPWRVWDGWGPTSDGLMGFARLGPESGERVLVHDEQRDLYATRADAEFIAHAREDVPALVARLRQLEAERSHLVDLRRVAYFRVRPGGRGDWEVEDRSDVVAVFVDIEATS